MLSLRRRTLWTALFGIVAAAAMAYAGCGSDQNRDGSTSGGGPKSCTVDAECDDDNPCTIDSCGQDKLCAGEPVPDGEAPEQVEGDCRTTFCNGGVADDQIEDGDLPDDHESCTLDSCDNGDPVFTPQIDDTVCYVGQGQGYCKSGACVVTCTPATAQYQCDDQEQCTEDACIDDGTGMGTGVCEHSKLSNVPVPGGGQTTGDCHEYRCIDGAAEDVEDAFDVPEDGNDCTKDECKAGTPVNTPEDKGAVCAQNGGAVCDGEGACVQCIVASDCTQQSGDCYQAACVNGYCGTDYLPYGTPLPPAKQTKGDCQQAICDGGGSTTSEADDTDLSNDNNVCTVDGCQSGYPTHTPVAPGTPCGNGNVCDAGGSCCTPQTCAMFGYDCGTISNGCGFTVMCGACQLGDTCGAQAYNKCCHPKTCADFGAQCGSISDGCGGTKNCGSCDPGDPCGWVQQNQCGCNDGFQDNQETDVDCGGICSQKCGQGKKCSTGGDCASGACVDGVCCDAACNGACQACSAALTGQPDGMCASVMDGTDPTDDCVQEAQSTCGNSGLCKGGACEQYPAGTQCAAPTCAAGVENKADVCNGTGQCTDGGVQACGANYACVGSTCGSCSDGLKDGKETDVDCGGGGVCGGCTNGKVCLVAGDCTSGNCVDGVCCNTSCGGLCQRCNLAPTPGTCSFIPSGQDPDNECSGLKSCNGSGACQ